MGANQYSRYFFVCRMKSELFENLNDGENEVTKALFESTYQKMDDEMNTPEYYPGLYVVRGVYSKEIDKNDGGIYAYLRKINSSFSQRYRADC